MKSIRVALAIAVIGMIQELATAQVPLGTAFTYQGQLKESGAPASGAYDLRFMLFDAATLGSQVGATVCVEGVVPVDGLFTVALDFGAAAFSGDARWMEIGVRSDATPGNCAGGVYATLTTRQALTAAPYALFALNGPGGGGLWTADGSTIHNTNAGNVGVGTATPAHALDVNGDIRVNGRAAFGNDGAIGLQDAYERIFDFSHTITDFSSTDSWAGLNSVFRLEPTLDLTGANAKYFYSDFFWVEIPPGNPHDIRYLQGPYIYAANNGTGSAEIVAGAFISAQSEGDVVEHVGCEIGAWGLGSNANITNNYALSLRTGQLHAGGSIENNYALYIDAPESVVDIQNSYGIYMADQTVPGADESWAIYSDGGRSYFADGVNIGATFDSPYKLVVVNETDHAIFGKVEGNSGTFAYGVYGQSDSVSGGGGVFGIAPIYGVRGVARALSGTALGGEFTSDSTDGVGVFGYASADTGLNFGVRGRTDSPAGFAGYFEGRGHFSGNLGLGTTAPGYRLEVQENTTANEAVYVRNSGTGRAATFESLGAGGVSAVVCYKDSGAALQVLSDFSTAGAVANDAPLAVAGGSDSALGGGGFIVCGDTSGANISIDNNEIMARSAGAAGGLFLNHNGGDVLIGAGGGAGNVGIGISTPTLAKVQIDVANQRCIYGENNSATQATAYFDNLGTGPAGVFQGNVTVVGNLTKSSGSFRIDHPLDPANQYLYHSFVESPDMMNIYNGTVVTDERGYATITMPEWFEVLNRDFRYLLTVIDDSDSEEFVQAKVVRKLKDSLFAIRSSAPNVEVSWQITGIRQDPWAEAHRIPVEEQKPEHERGKYQHPELYGQPAESAMNYRAAAVADADAADPN